MQVAGRTHHKHNKPVEFYRLEGLWVANGWNTTMSSVVALSSHHRPNRTGQALAKLLRQSLESEASALQILARSMHKI